jgi:adenosylcobinamide-phosphate synthase
LVNIFAILVALLLDQQLGEPRRFHPLVGFGVWAAGLERRFNRPVRAAGSLLLGLSAWLLAILPVMLPIFAAYLLWADYRWLMDALLGYLCIARRSLREHVLAVYRALTVASLADARALVGRIVSRETGALDALGVRKATIESALENGSDAIFAPLFWLAVGGAPAVVLYRLTNTLDAMWGYRNERYRYFGRVAARADDLLNWVPARLTALSFVLLGRSGTALRAWREQAPQCASPNAGPVMASGAGAMAVVVGGPAVYHGRVEERPVLGFGRAPEDADLLQSLALLDRTLALWCGVIIASWLAWSMAFLEIAQWLN